MFSQNANSSPSNHGEVPQRTLQLQFSAKDLDLPASTNATAGLLHRLLRPRKPNSMYKVSAFRPAASGSSSIDSPFQVVFKSKIITNDKNPQWESHEIDMALLCGSIGFDALSPIQISVWDKTESNNNNGEVVEEETLIGTCETTIFDLNNFNNPDNNNGSDPFDGQKSSRHGFELRDDAGHVSGILVPLDASIYEKTSAPSVPSSSSSLLAEEQPHNVKEVSIPKNHTTSSGSPAAGASTKCCCNSSRDDDETTVSCATASTLMESFHQSLNSETSKLRSENQQLRVRVADLEMRLRDQAAKLAATQELAASLDDVQKELAWLREECNTLRAEQKQQRRKSTSGSGSGSGSGSASSGRSRRHTTSSRSSRKPSTEERITSRRHSMSSGHTLVQEATLDSSRSHAKHGAESGDSRKHASSSRSGRKESSASSSRHQHHHLSRSHGSRAHRTHERAEALDAVAGSQTDNPST